MGVFSAPKVDKWPQKSKFSFKICSFWRFWWGNFWQFLVSKSLFLDFFRREYFQLSMLINDPKNRNYLSKICSFGRFVWVIFDNFAAKNSFSGNFRIFEKLKVNYLYTLLSTTEILLWGAADALHQEKSKRILIRLFLLYTQLFCPGEVSIDDKQLP